MKPNFKDLIRQELVSRFENVVKDEISKNEKYLNEVSNSINFLKSSIDEIKKDMDFQQTCFEDSFNDVKKLFELEKKLLQSDFEEHRRFIRIYRDKSDCFYISIESLLDKKTDVGLFLELKEKNSNEIAIIHEKIEKSLKESKKYTYDCCKNLEKRISGLDGEKENIIYEMASTFEELEEKIKASSIDHAGVLKDLQVFKKYHTILEKKFEYLYDEIERLKKGK